MRRQFLCHALHRTQDTLLRQGSGHRGKTENFLRHEFQPPPTQYRIVYTPEPYYQPQTLPAEDSMDKQNASFVCTKLLYYQ